MIVIDYNGIAIAGVVVQKMEINEELIRHMILNSIRMYNKKFRSEYGQVVIACDARTWRRDYFPNYKFKRRENRDDSASDWDEIFRIINQVRDEIAQNFPYKVIHIDGCEADDIIGALAYETQEFGKHEPMMIVSSDKDFIQLQKFSNVKQFSPMQKKAVTDKNPRQYLFEHIMKGDSGDGIPNCLSPDNTFVDGIRQSPVTKKKIEHWLEHAEDLQSAMDENTYRNYVRNKNLIDLSCTPSHIKEAIINKFEEDPIGLKRNVLNYLIKKRCKMLIECVEEFY